jgi:hypothetical protein
MDRPLVEPKPETGQPERTSDLQLQIEQLTLAVRQIRQSHDRVQQMEGRLARMIEESAQILDRWARTDEQHATAVGELHHHLADWSAIEQKMLSESAVRIQQFEHGLEHEWHALKERHERPLHAIQQDADRILEACLTASDSTLRGFERAGATFTALQETLQRQMSDLARQVQHALEELRTSHRDGTPQLAAQSPWPLDDVMRVHENVRASTEPSYASRRSLLTSGSEGPRVVSDGATFAVGAAEQRDAGRRWWYVAAVIAIGLAVAGAAVLYNRIDRGLREASARAAAAEREAASTRDVATREIAAAQQLAQQHVTAAEKAATSAQAVTAVLIAPDLRRVNLTGGPTAPTAYGQVLWSRSRGMLVNAARLPAAPDARAYVLWILTATGAVRAGEIQPEANGQVNVALDPVTVRGAAVGMQVTLEGEGAASPSGPVYLTTRSE